MTVVLAWKHRVAVENALRQQIDLITKYMRKVRRRKIRTPKEKFICADRGASDKYTRCYTFDLQTRIKSYSLTVKFAFNFEYLGPQNQLIKWVDISL
jgi:hypothetical protein